MLDKQTVLAVIREKRSLTVGDLIASFHHSSDYSEVNYLEQILQELLDEGQIACSEVWEGDKCNTIPGNAILKPTFKGLAKEAQGG